MSLSMTESRVEDEERRYKEIAGATCIGMDGRIRTYTDEPRWDWVMTAVAPGGRLWAWQSGYSSYSLFLLSLAWADGTSAMHHLWLCLVQPLRYRSTTTRTLAHHQCHRHHRHRTIPPRLRIDDSTHWHDIYASLGLTFSALLRPFLPPWKINNPNELLC